MGEPRADKITVAEAVRHSALFAASAGLITFTVSLAVIVGDYGSLIARAVQHADFFLAWPVWAILIAGLVQFALLARGNVTRRWDFAWRGALASYVGIAAATSGFLIVVEVLGGRPGAAGGFFLIIASLIGFTVIGGPLLAGLLAAALRPRRLAPPQRGRARTVGNTDGRRRLGYALLFAGTAACLGLVATSAFISGRNICEVSGPVPSEPPLAVVSEASGIVEGSFSLWPLGRQCEWDRADGRGTVVVNSGAWGSTALAAGAGLVGLGGAALVLWSSPTRST